MIIDNKDVDAIYITDKDKKILCIIDDDNIIAKKEYVVNIIDSRHAREFRIIDFDGEPKLIERDYLDNKLEKVKRRPKR